MNRRTTSSIVLLVAATCLLGWIAHRSQQRVEQTTASNVPQLDVNNPAAESTAPTTVPPTHTKERRLSTIEDIIERRDQQIAEIKRRAYGFEIEADRRQIAEIQRDAEQQIKALLSDAENRALQVEDFKRTDLGKALTDHLAATPEELAFMSDYEKDLAEVLATPGGDLEGVQSRNLEKLKAFVGEDRAQEFLNCHDPDYVEALGFLKRFNLAPETIKDLVKLRVEREKISLDYLKQGLRPPPTDPAVAESFRTRLKELLGPEAGEIYIREAKGALIWR